MEQLIHKKKIETPDDIRLLVDTFYDKVKNDALLAPVFEERINGQWGPHLEKMYKFWHTLLLGQFTYTGNPFRHHALLPVDHAHFVSWMSLFTATLDSLFEGEKCEEAKVKAATIAATFEAKIVDLQKHNL